MRQNIDGLVMNLTSVIVFATLAELTANLLARSIGAYASRGCCHFRASTSRFLACHASLNSTMTSAIKQHPLFGFLPRNVTAKQVKRVIVCCVFCSSSRRVFDVVCRRAVKIRSLDCHTPLNISKFSRLEKSYLSLHRWRNFMIR